MASRKKREGQTRHNERYMKRRQERTLANLLTMMYHGTRSHVLEAILKDGIVPRRDGSGNWPDVQTRTDVVYLTKFFAHIYAKQAATSGGAWLILEVNSTLLNKKAFLPDDDGKALELTHLTRQQALPILAEFRANLEKQKVEYLEKSLSELGNCCVNEIVPTKAITRYCVVDVSRRQHLSEIITSSTVPTELRKSLKLNEQVTAWLFGDRATLPEIPGVSAADLERESQDRTGIEVVRIPNSPA